MADQAELNTFLQSVERRAFRMAEFAVRNADDALDIVQDAMLGLATRYADRPTSEWRPLFYRILHSRIMDWHRHQGLRRRLFGWLPGNDDEDDVDPLSNVAGEVGTEPEHRATVGDLNAALVEAIGALPVRQQQAFLLRSWEGLDVRETAAAMGCSEGSVKTHHSRAVRALRQRLGPAWDVVNETEPGVTA